MYVHIFIGTYILSEGSEYPSEIFWEIFWYKKFCGKINRQQGLPSSADRCWQVLLQVGYHSATAKSIERVVRMGEDSWAHQALAFELFGTVLDLTGSVRGELTRVGRGWGMRWDMEVLSCLLGLVLFFCIIAASLLS